MTEKELRERERDAAHWAKLHVRSDKAKAITLPQRLRRSVLTLRGGKRVEGGFKVHERG